MKFAELSAGQVIEAGPYLVTMAELLQFAQAYDPQWIHTDAERAARGRFGGLIASGWHTCSIAMRLMVDSVLKDSECFVSPGVHRIQWTHPVRAGDALRLRTTVVEARRARAKPALGVMRSRWQMRNADDIEVMNAEATSLYDLAQAPTAQGVCGAARRK